MDAQTMRRKVEQAQVGRLATVSAEGEPHAIPICYTVRGDTAYSAVDHKPKRHSRLRRIANLEQTGRACLLVDEYGTDWSQLWWVRLDGRGRVVDDPDEASRATAALAEKYPQYQERPPAGPVIAIAIDRWRGWSAQEAGGA